MARFAESEINLLADAIEFVEAYAKITAAQLNSLHDIFDFVLDHSEDGVLYDHDPSFDADFACDRQRDLNLFPHL